MAEAACGQAAIDLLEAGNTHFDVVLSDVVMPGGISGFDLRRWIQSHRPGLKILLTSGFSEEIASSRGRDAASVKLLRKPYSRVQLARALRSALDE